MILAGNQPYFCPYFPYFQLIHAADVFLIGDDYAFIKKGWIHRNRILINGEPQYFGIEVKKSSSYSNINELEMCKPDIRQKRRTLSNSYARAPYFKEGIELFDQIFSCEESNLSLFLENSLHIFCDYMGIQTPFIRSSQFEGNAELKLERRIYDFCHQIGADTYINAIGGMELYQFEKFKAQNIELKFIQSHIPEYKQFAGKAIRGLSILDVIMFNSKETIREMLDDYSLVTADDCGEYINEGSAIFK